MFNCKHYVFHYVSKTLAAWYRVIRTEYSYVEIISIYWRLFIFKKPIELKNNFNTHYSLNVFSSHIRRGLKWFVENPWSWELLTPRVTLMRHKLLFLCVFLLLYKIDFAAVSDFQVRVFVPLWSSFQNTWHPIEGLGNQEALIFGCFGGRQTLQKKLQET